MSTKKCQHCLKVLSTEQFYKKTGRKNGYFSYCKSCESIRKKQQLVNFKKQCLEYKNQFCCSSCGYNKSIVALDFHHVDPSSKNFSISQCNNLSLNQRIKDELDKCTVLCANCHREKHSTEDGVFIPKILKQKSSPICLICGNGCSRGNQRCKSCYIKSQSANVPSKEQLLSDINHLKYQSVIGRKYGVSGNAVKKWCKKYNIPS